MKLVLCVPDTSTKAKQAVNVCKLSDSNNTIVACLGESEGCTNVYELMQTISIKDAPDPVDVQDVKKERLLIFWSSGTTGIAILVFQKYFITNISKFFITFTYKV